MAQQLNKKLIGLLAECAAECDQCATGMLEENDVKSLARCIRLTLDCASVCRTTAEFVARGSDHTQRILQECIAICEDCASECEKVGSRVEMCKACAETCRRCADECRNMSGGARSAGR